MRKFFILLMSAFWALPFGFSQNRIVLSENFDKGSHIFTASPAQNWQLDTLWSLSGKQSVWGMVPNAEGDSVELISPVYDLSNYVYAYLRFSHICKVSDSDFASVEYREAYIGAPWKHIPMDDYRGTSSTYRRSGFFNHKSYPAWMGGSLMAQPENSWWKTEAFDISQDVAYGQVQFKFKIKRGTTRGTNFAWGWFIDNFELTCSSDPINPPYMELLPPFAEGIVYSPGPFTINVKAARRTILPIRVPVMSLIYTMMDGSVVRDSLLMQPYEGDSIWTGVIPAQKIGTQVTYTISARDSVGNNASVSSGYTIGRVWGFDSVSAALTAIDTPSYSALAGANNPVAVVLQNRGLMPLTSAKISWSLNGVIQTPVQWTGNLPEGYSESVRIGTYLARNDFDTITAWVSQPNGKRNTSPDTLVRRRIYGCQQIFSGTYTVGPNGQFKTLPEALATIQLCGMKGNTTLSIEKGEYHQTLEMFDYMNVLGPKDTLTLVSATGKKEDVVLYPTPKTGDRIFLINNSRNLVFSHLTLNGYECMKTLVSLLDTNANIQFDHCDFLADTTSNAMSKGITLMTIEPSQGGTSHNIRIISNYFQGGTTCFGFFGEQNKHINLVELIDNRIVAFEQTGLETKGIRFGHINRNVFRPLAQNPNGNTRVIYIGDAEAEEICGNRILSLPGSQLVNGMELYHFNADSSCKGLIANNDFVMNLQDGFGLAISESCFDLVNNSIVVNSSGQKSKAVAFHCCNSSKFSYAMHIYNNSFVSYTMGYPVEFDDASNLGTDVLVDYNNVYGLQSLGYCGMDINDLATWRKATGDQHAVSVNPAFSNVEVSSKCIHYSGMDCPMHPSVDQDIEGNSRLPLTNMGCYAESSLAFNASLISLADWASTYTTTPHPVKVVLMNAGSTDTLTSCTLQWALNGVQQTPKQWTGKLEPYTKEEILLGNFLPILGNNVLKAWVSLPNGKTDAKASDDTVSATTYGCEAPMGGVMTVGDAQSDFPTLNDAIYKLINCGLNAPLTLKLLPGTYPNVEIGGNIPGLSSQNTVTITSATGKAEDVLIVAKTAAVKLDGVSHVRLVNLTLDARKGGDGLVFNGKLSDIQVLHCNIWMDPKSGNNDYQYGIRSENQNVTRDDIVIVGNHIDGGYYSIYLFNGYGTTYGQHGHGGRIDSNLITNSFSYNMYAYYTDVSSISHNRILARQYDGYNYFYGIYTYYCNVDSVVGNYIDAYRDYFANTHNPIRLNYCNYGTCTNNPKKVCIVANNELRSKGLNGYVYGLYVGYGNFKVYHNSVYVDCPYNYSYCIYAYTASGYLIDIRNNNVFLFGTGANAYPIYANSSSKTLVQFSHNNVYRPSGNIAYVGAALANLKAFQAYDVDASSVYPEFLDFSKDMNIRKTAASPLLCPSLPEAMYDRYGTPRPKTTVVGAYSGQALTYNASLAAFDAPNAPTLKPGTSEKVSVQLLNRGDNDITSATIYWSVNGVAQKSYTWKGKLSPNQKEAVALGSFSGVLKENTLTAYVVLNDQKDALPADDTVFLKIYGCENSLQGTYIVGKGGDFATLDNALEGLANCGVSSHVILKLEPGIYPDMVIQGQFPGSGPLAQVTFTSVTGKAEDVVIKGVNTKKGLILNGAGYLNFEHLTLGDTLTNITAVDIQSTLTDVTFHYCDMYAVAGQLNSQAYCIDRTTTTNSLVKTLTLNNCLIYGGYDNIRIQYAGISSANLGAIVMDSCRLLNGYSYGFFSYTNGYYSLTARNNYLQNSPSSISYSGFRFGSAVANINIDTLSGNTIRCNASNSNYGIYVGQNVNTIGPLAKKYALFFNNEICIEGKATTSYGLDYNSPNYIDFSHNTVYINTTGTRYGIHTYNTATTGSARSYANIIYMAGTSGSAQCVNHSQGAANLSPSLIDMNNNVYYNEQGMEIGHGAASIKAWNALVNNDMNSVWERPSFISPESYNFHTTGTSAIVNSNPSVPRDKNGIFRSKITNAGCYHDFIPEKYDLHANACVHPLNGAVTGSRDSVLVNFINMGQSTITSATIQWTLNGVKQADFKWNSQTGIAYGEEITKLNIGTFTVPSGKYRIVIWTENPNGMADADPSNDTIVYDVIACDSNLNGTYTIGGAQANFTTLEDAVNMLYSCGIDGPVVFRMNPGNYSAVEFSGDIRGTSAINTITFTSANQDAGSVVIGEDAVTALKLRNVSHLKFNRVTIGSTASGKLKTTVLLESYIEDLDFYHCNLLGNVTTSDASTYVVYYNNSSNSTIYLKDARFIGNTILGAYYGLYLRYPAGSTANCLPNAKTLSTIIIDSNYVAEQYYYPIYIYYYAYLKSVSHNVVKSHDKGANSYGIYLYYTLADRIEGNRIYTNVSSYAYGGLRLYYVNYPTAYGSGIHKAMVCNNEVMSTGLTVYGIYASYTHADILYNSVYCKGNTNYAFYINGGNSNCYLNYTHNLMMTENGSTANYMVYASAAVVLNTYPTFIDSNIFFTAGTNKNNFYCSSAMNFTRWRSTYPKIDAATIEYKPDFVDLSTDMRIRQFDEKMKCERDARITSDVNGEARTRLTVLGAYSTPLFEGNDLLLSAYVEPLTSGIQCVPNSTPVKLRVYNQGIHTADFSETPMKLYLKCESDSVNLQVPISITSGTINVMAYDTFEVLTNLDITYPGMYRLTSWIEWGKDQQKFNDTLKLDYLVDKTILPYDNNFTGTLYDVATDQMYGDIRWEIVDQQKSPSPVFGTSSLLFRSSEARGSISQAIFSSMTLQGTYRPQLYFWYAHDNQNPNLHDQMEVRLSQDGGVTFKTLKTLYRYDAAYSVPTWKEYQIDLSPYNTGHCIVLAFTAYSFGGGDQALDRVKIIAQQDMQVLVDAPVEADFSACNMTGRSLTVYLENMTAQEVPFKDGDSLTVEMSGASNFVYKQALKGRLENREIDTLVVRPIDYVGGGIFDVKVYVNSIDSNEANDTACFSLNLKPDLAVVSIDPIPYAESGDTVTVGITVVNTGNLNVVQPFDVRLLINQKDAITESIHQMMKPGDTLHYTFTHPIIIPPTEANQPYYMLDIFALLGCDAYAENDSIRFIGNVNVADNGILSITTPATEKCAKGGTSIAIEARLFNRGNMDNTDSLTITALIDSAGTVCQTLKERMAPMYSGEDRNYTFTQKYTVPRLSVNEVAATYKVTVFLSSIEKDADLSNDTASVEACVEGGLGVKEALTEAWNMEQNIPNPAFAVTKVPFVLPQAGEVVFSIMSMDGRVLHKEILQAQAGNNELNADISNFAAGIYYYSMEYQGRLIVRKMNVVR